MKTRPFIAILVALALPGPLSAQIVFSHVTGWDGANNPSTNGPWRLGYKTTVTGALTLFTQNATFTSGGLDLEFWSMPSGTEPGIGFNLSSTTNWSDGGSNVAPQELNLHPGAGGEMAVIRFTAPTAGDYDFTGTLSGNGPNFGGTTTTAYMVHNAATFYTQAVTGYDSTYGFAVSRSLAAGDTVDLVVDWGSNGTYTSDSTGLYLTVTAVPEPAACALLGGLLALAGIICSRRRGVTPHPVA